MNPSKKIQRIQHLLRNAGLLGLVERVRYVLSVLNCAAQNRKFVLENPDFKVPPQALAYDAYSAPHWNFYKTSGEKTASELFSMVSKHIAKNELINILEWGCGPARVIRHIPHAFDAEVKVLGCDYNPESINWCKNNIPNVEFVLNALSPPLPFDSNQFDFIYSISVFTHLSESVSHQWIDELYRVTRPNGILIISMNGDSRMSFLLPDELVVYKTKGIVIRDKFEEGKKMFFSCHSPKYLRESLFRNFLVLEHVPEGFPYTGQDMWIIKKSGSL